MPDSSFIDEEIQVDFDKEKLYPASFTWRGATYTVVDLIHNWQDWSTPAYAKHAQGWIHRRHRNHYVVRTADDQTFELYLDRGAKRPTWVLLKRL